MKANELPKSQQAKLKKILQHKAIERLINDMLVNPPEIDLSKVDIKVPAHMRAKDVDVMALSWSATGGCETCSAIGGGCETCSAIS